MALKIVFRADGYAMEKIKGAIPSATFRGGTCEVRIEGRSPAEVADRAKTVLETLRKAG